MTPQRKLGRAYGWHQPKLPLRRRHFLPKLAWLSDLPQELDWALKFPAQWPAVYDQGQTGSCVGQGCKRVAHTLQIEQGLLPVIEPSALFIYFNARDAEGDTDQDSGASVADGFSSLTKAGWCAESDWPLDPNILTTRPNARCYADALRNLVDQFQPAAIDNTELQAMLEALKSLGLELDPADDAQARLIKTAWDIAKAAKFWSP